MPRGPAGPWYQAGMQARQRPLPAAARRQRALVLCLALLALITAILLVRRGDDGAAGGRLVPRDAPSDPFAWAPGRDAILEDAASQGLAHVLAVLSPGGAAATAERVERFRGQVRDAVGSSGL